MDDNLPLIKINNSKENLIENSLNNIREVATAAEMSPKGNKRMIGLAQSFNSGGKKVKDLYL